MRTGLNLKLDVGFSQADLAGRSPHRYRGKPLDATTSIRDRAVAFIDSVKAAFAVPAYATAVA